MLAASSSEDKLNLPIAAPTSTKLQDALRFMLTQGPHAEALARDL
jgi:hypothetical protein